MEKAAALLCQLCVWEANVRDMVERAVVPLLTKLVSMKACPLETWHAATMTLASIGMLPEYTDMLADCGAPAYVYRRGGATV